MAPTASELPVRLGGEGSDAADGTALDQWRSEVFRGAWVTRSVGIFTLIQRMH